VVGFRSQHKFWYFRNHVGRTTIATICTVALLAAATTATASPVPARSIRATQVQQTLVALEYCVRLDLARGFASFRASPKAASKVLAKIDKGSCGITASPNSPRSGGFLRVKYRGRTGWVLTKEVETLEPNSFAPTSVISPSVPDQTTVTSTTLPVTSTKPTVPAQTVTARVTTLPSAPTTVSDAVRRAQEGLERSRNEFRAVLLAWGATDERILFDAWSHSWDWCRLWDRKSVSLDRAFLNSYDYVAYLVSISDNRVPGQGFEVIKTTWQNWCRRSMQV
jgi:hypothetical protein